MVSKREILKWPDWRKSWTPFQVSHIWVLWFCFMFVCFLHTLIQPTTGWVGPHMSPIWHRIRDVSFFCLCPLHWIASNHTSLLPKMYLCREYCLTQYVIEWCSYNYPFLVSNSSEFLVGWCLRQVVSYPCSFSNISCYTDKNPCTPSWLPALFNKLYHWLIVDPSLYGQPPTHLRIVSVHSKVCHINISINIHLKWKFYFTDKNWVIQMPPTNTLRCYGFQPCPNMFIQSQYVFTTEYFSWQIFSPKDTNGKAIENKNKIK